MLTTAILALVILSAVMTGPPEPVKVYRKEGDSIPTELKTPVVRTVCWGACILVPSFVILVLEKGWPQ
jgi:hypothetical protein